MRISKRHITSTLACVVVGATAAALTATPARAAEPVPLSCGAVLATDAYLAADLLCATGITVTSDSNLDLRGHRLTGPGTTVGQSGGVAVTVTGASNVKISNGQIDHWTTGVTALQPSDDLPDYTVTMDHVTFTDNDSGVVNGESWGGPFATMKATNSRFENNRSGMYGIWSGGTVVDRSVFLDNSGEGITSIEGRSVTITNSAVDGSATGILCGDSCTITDTQIKNNDVGARAREGSLKFRNSVISNNQTGVSVEGLGSADLGNTAVRRNTTGVLVGQFSRTTATRSVFDRNAIGVTSQPPGPELDSLSYTVALRNNTFSRNGDGIVLRRDLDSRTVIGSNLAYYNTGYGIYTPGATDLGGNSAAGNGKPCVGVVCRRP